MSFLLYLQDNYDLNRQMIRSVIMLLSHLAFYDSPHRLIIASYQIYCDSSVAIWIRYDS